MYIWQTNKAWPDLVFSAETVKPRLDDVLALQKQLVGKAKSLPENIDQQAEMDALIQDAIQTSQFEGEKLNAGSVRSSVAKQLGLQNQITDNHKFCNSISQLLCRKLSLFRSRTWTVRAVGHYSASSTV